MEPTVENSDFVASGTKDLITTPDSKQTEYYQLRDDGRLMKLDIPLNDALQVVPPKVEGSNIQLPVMSVEEYIKMNFKNSKNIYKYNP